MARNRIPNNYESLVIMLEHAITGAQQHGPEIGLKQNDEAALRATLENLAGVSAGAETRPGLKDRGNSAKTAKIAGTAALQAAENQGRALMSACIGILKPRLGNQWNATWRDAGFTDGSLRVALHPLIPLRHLQSYFAAHPEHEVGNLTDRVSCTAAGCGAAADAIAAADAASRQTNMEAGAAKKALEDGIETARIRVTGLRNELAQLIAEDDPRWIIFGFDRPNASIVPEIPGNLVLTSGGTGALHADWDDARRAESYRATVLDSEGKSLAERLVAESEAMFTGLPSGAVVHVVVTARNEAGESRACEPVEATVP